jgi:S-adenosylmethionine synthetase
MIGVNVRPLERPSPGALPVEIVELKGLGHPDSICDSLVEELSLRLSRRYAERFGGVLHHNVDKALLVGGAARPAFGGGEVVKPIEIYLSGRATSAYRGETIPIEDLARDGTDAWLRGHLHALDPVRHVKLHCLVRPGSAELVELFERARKTGVVLANDTSCGAGFAPLSELETVVYETARALNAPRFLAAHPAAARTSRSWACAKAGRSSSPSPAR